jgi:hypothetical protein
MCSDSFFLNCLCINFTRRLNRRTWALRERSYRAKGCSFSHAKSIFFDFLLGFGGVEATLNAHGPGSALRVGTRHRYIVDSFTIMDTSPLIDGTIHELDCDMDISKMGVVLPSTQSTIKNNEISIINARYVDTSP